jgi:integrase
VLVRKGVNPQAEADRERLAAQRQRENSFAAVVEDYIRLEVIGPDPAKPKQRKGHEVARELRRVFVLLWGDRPVTSITRRDVLAAIEDVRDHGTAQMLARRGSGRNGGSAGRPAPTQARNLLAYLKTLLRWAVERDAYGLESSPCADMRAQRIVGQKRAVDRILSDDELRAFWRATGRMKFPYQPIYRLLLLTGLRLNEVADAAWPEFDLKNKLWTIPAARMKGKNGTARPHAVPLTKEMLDILAAIPRFRRGEHLFSTTFGEKPVWVNDKIKKALDARMLRTLRAVARMNGDDYRRVQLPPWTNHDLRRTLRSGLSALRVNSDVSEAVLAHVKPGIRGVYDRHDYLDEKRHALEAWAGKLGGIVEPPPSNAVPIASAR